MKTIYLKNTKEIKENKFKLQNNLGAGINIKGNQITLSGKEANIYEAERVLRAISLGFPYEVAILLIDPEYMFEEIHIKQLTKRKNLQEVRARIIGTRGKTKKVLQNLSNCCIRLRDNIVYLIGTCDEISEARTALEKLIHGSKQSKVYSFLERSRRRNKKREEEQIRKSKSL